MPGKRMRRGRRAGTALLGLVLLMAGAAAFGTEADGDGEHARLLQKQRQLERKIADLEREQGYLGFLRVLRQSDSKYLLLDLSNGRGTLMYRDRVLRTFRLSWAGGPRGQALPGMVTITEKKGPLRSERQLVFGDALVLQGKKGNGSRRAAHRYALGAKDLAALSYALEVGALAYVVP